MTRKWTYIAIPLAVLLAGLLSLKVGLNRWVYSNSRPPERITDFTLLDHSGVIHSLHRYSDSKLIVLVSHGNSCTPLSQRTKAWNQFRKDMEPLGVATLFLNSVSEDDRTSLIQFAETHQLEIPILMDPSQSLARHMGLTDIGEALIVQPKTWKVLFKGSSDEILENKAVIEKTLAGEILPEGSPGRESCPIQFRDLSLLTYEYGIVPIIQEKCLTCHNPMVRQAPILKSYDSLRSWQEMIKETVFTERMPPWSADPHYGTYANDISLTPEEKFKLMEWFRIGAPRLPGIEDPLITARPISHKIKRGVDGDLLYTAEMSEEQKIPPAGDLEYRYTQLGGPAPFDMWVRSTHTRTNNPRELHHMAVTIVPEPLEYYGPLAQKWAKKKKTPFRQYGAIPAFTIASMRDNSKEDPHFVRFQAWASGRKQPFTFPDGYALHIPKGYYVILESHYMGTGKSETEKTSIDFYGSKDKGDLSAVRTLMVYANKIMIPPNVKRHVTVSRWFPVKEDLESYGILSHMHMRGRAIKGIIKYPDGREQTLLSIPNFYYGWQTGAGLIFEKPILLPKGSLLQTICEHDNSSTNPLNPDPNLTVYFGQTHDRTEMCTVNYLYRVVKGTP